MHSSSFIFALITIAKVVGTDVPYMSLNPEKSNVSKSTESQDKGEFLPFIKLVEKDTSEFWHEKKLLSIVLENENEVDYEKCEQNAPDHSLVRFPSRRTVRPICRSKTDYQLCPQCPHFNNNTECELFRDSCKERRVFPMEYKWYCDKKYGKWRTMFIPADFAQCRCCDECIFYREMDQSCVADEYAVENEETLPVTSIDFRAGCNPYWGHPEQELRALRCDKTLRRCVPVNIPIMPDGSFQKHNRYRFEPTPEDMECPVTCRGYTCPANLKTEEGCPRGAFIPERELCNCCGSCSPYRQLYEKCAEFKKAAKNIDGVEKTEIEEELLEPGCDDGLVCRKGYCEDIHNVQVNIGKRTRRGDGTSDANEPCKEELKYFIKKYGPSGHLHYDAPQCSPLWLYAPVQCRRFVCYCALEDGSFIQGIKVPRVEVANMNCDCAREKCRVHSEVECDGYGNYREAVFTPRSKSWDEEYDNGLNYKEKTARRDSTAKAAA